MASKIDIQKFPSDILFIFGMDIMSGPSVVANEKYSTIQESPKNEYNDCKSVSTTRKDLDRTESEVSSSTNHQAESSHNITALQESEFFKLDSRSNNKSHSMELPLSPNSGLSSRSHHQAQSLATENISMSSSHHHLLMASQQAQQQPNQLLASNAHNGGQVHELPPSSNASISQL